MAGSLFSLRFLLGRANARTPCMWPVPRLHLPVFSYGSRSQRGARLATVSNTQLRDRHKPTLKMAANKTPPPPEEKNEKERERERQRKRPVRLLTVHAGWGGGDKEGREGSSHSRHQIVQVHPESHSPYWLGLGLMNAWPQSSTRLPATRATRTTHLD